MNQKYESTSTLDPRIIAYIQTWIGSTKIFIVSKSRCKQCRSAKALLREVAGTDITPLIFEIDSYPHTWTKVFFKYLSAQSKVSTVPLIWINGKSIGGFEDILRLHKEGRLVYLFQMKTLGLRNLKKSRISTTYIIPTKRKPSKNTKAPTKPSTVKQSVEKTPILRIQRNKSVGVNKGNRKSCCLRRNSVSYRPLTFSVDDDIKTPMRNSKTLSRPRAQSLGNILNDRKNECEKWFLRLSTQTTGSSQEEEAKISKDRTSSEKLLFIRGSGGQKITRHSSWI